MTAATTATTTSCAEGNLYGYARVSTTDQHPEAQTDRLRAAGCGDRIRTDRGVSGSKASRPQWDLLLDELRPGDTLVCVKLDRIGRSVANLVDIVARLRAKGVELLVLDQNIDTRTPAGKLLFHMLAAIAEFERDLIIERTRDGQAAVRLGGNMRRIMGGQPPLGFRDPGGDDESRDWELDPQSADWLARAAALVLDDPLHRVEAAFNSLEPMTDSTLLPDGSRRPVNVKMLRKALQRPASAGLLEVGGEQLGEAEVGGPLDADTFARLRVVFAARRVGRPPTEGRYPFGPLLRCSRCGNQLTGSLGWKQRGYYGCNNPHVVDGVTRKPCRGVSVASEDVHVLLRTAVEEWAASPQAAAALAELPAADDDRRAELLALVADQQAAMADVMDKRHDGYLTRARYEELSAQITRAIDAARAELASLEAAQGSTALPVIDWQAMTSAEQRRAVELALQTPIKVLPGNGGVSAVPVSARVVLLPVSG